MIPLGKNRFITVNLFKGKPLINIREYYQKDTCLLPTKKGISLSPEQYKQLKNVLSEIDEKLKAI